VRDERRREEMIPPYEGLVGLGVIYALGNSKFNVQFHFTSLAVKTVVISNASMQIAGILADVH